MLECACLQSADYIRTIQLFPCSCSTSWSSSAGHSKMTKTYLQGCGATADSWSIHWHAQEATQHAHREIYVNTLVVYICMCDCVCARGIATKEAVMSSLFSSSQVESTGGNFISPRYGYSAKHLEM